jgi:integrase
MCSYRLNFTKKGLEQLPTPDKITIYHDTKMQGLKLKVQPSGSKTFMLYRKISGKPERIMLGTFPAVTIEGARGQVSEYNSQIAKGINPANQQRIIRAEMTFEELFKQYMERHAKLHKRTFHEDEQRYQLHLTEWRKRKLSSIKRTDVQQLHAKLGVERGHYAANHTLAMLSTMFNKAYVWGWEHPNPAKGVQKFKEKSRERFLQADELPRFFQALQEEPNQMMRDYFLLSLFTGARRANVLSMRWEEIYFERKTWEIPMTKHGGAHTVPLALPALEILERRKKVATGEWVFPGSGKTGHLVEPKKAWKRVLEKAELKNLRIHDLRRSLGSWQAVTGASLSVIGKTLAHKNVSTTAIYARLNLDPVRDSVQTAVNTMLTVGGITS